MRGIIIETAGAVLAAMAIASSAVGIDGFGGDRVTTAYPIMFGVAAAAATLAGGVLALRFSSRLLLVLGFTAGVVLGVALFDLVPEALELAGSRWSPRAIAGWMVLGLGAYMLIDRAFGRMKRPAARWRAQLGPATLTLHSLFDGLGIGLAFQIDARAGWVVAIAVLTHDVADGVNTVSLCLAAQAEGAARRWLLLNGAAPLLGVLLGLTITVSPAMLAPLLAMFAGVFLYIGACELLPRSHSLDPRPRTTLASLSGMALMFAVTSVVH